MKKRIKYLIIIIVLLTGVYVVVDTVITAKAKKDAEIALEKDKIASKKEYLVKRDNNKYTVSSSKLEDKPLQSIFYDGVSVYLYYDNDSKATLLKYNIEEKKTIVLYEDSDVIHGGMEKVGTYYKIGGSIYNNKFKKIIDYPELGENELLFPNLKKTLIKTDTGVSIKNLETGELKEIITNTEEDKYSPLSIKNDGKYILLSKTSNDKNYVVVLNNDYSIINTFIKAESDDKTYQLLDDVPYLLEKVFKDDKLTYKIYDTKTQEVTYKSSEEYKNYIFDNTKFICTDKDGNIKLSDYVTGEEKILITKKKKELTTKGFVIASDGYSLILTLNDTNNTFYIFYL